MHLLSIILNENTKTIKNLADKILYNYKYGYIYIDYSITENERENTISFSIDTDYFNIYKDCSVDEFINTFKQYCAIAIADYIVDGLEGKIVNKILQNNYSFVSKDEREFILQQFYKFIENEYDDNAISSKVNRKAKILYKLMDFLEFNSTINIVGFIKFRLKNYFDDLNDILDRAIEEYVMEKEYKEFIKLLRYFVNIQEPKIELLNIIVDKDGKYHLHDENFKVIDDKYIRELSDDLEDNNLSRDDMLISSLITMAPKRIIIHYAKNIKNNEIIETIENIFQEKVIICNSFKICNHKKEVREE